MPGRTVTEIPLVCVALQRADDHYVFRYEKGNEAKLLASLIDFAENDDLTFTWVDVLLIMRRLKV